MRLIIVNKMHYVANNNNNNNNYYYYYFKLNNIRNGGIKCHRH